MFVHVRWKSEEDPIKNVDARAVTTLSINLKMLKGSLLQNTGMRIPFFDKNWNPLYPPPI